MQHVQLKHLVKLGCLANGDTFDLGKLTAVVCTTANGVVGLRIKQLDNELKSGLRAFCKDHYDPAKSFMHELFGEEAASYGPCDPDLEGLFEPWFLSVNCFVRAGAHLQPELVSNKSQRYECPMLRSTLRSLWPQPPEHIEDTYTLLSIRLAFASVSGWDFKSGELRSAWTLDHDLVAIRDKANACREMEMAVANEGLLAREAAAAKVARKTVKAVEPPIDWEAAVNKISTPPRPYKMCENEVSLARVAFLGETVNQAPTAKSAWSQVPGAGGRAWATETGCTNCDADAAGNWCTTSPSLSRVPVRLPPAETGSTAAPPPVRRKSKELVRVRVSSS